MPLELIAVPVSANVITAAALTFTPVWARPGSYFGVRVSPDYRTSPEAKRSRRKFLLKIWSAGALAAALSAAGSLSSQVWVGLASVLLQVTVAIAAFRSGWRETSTHRIPAPSERTAHLLARPTRIPGGALAIAMPFCILIAVGGYLIAKWNSIPARFPIHWDFQGHANGWSERTVRGVFGPLGIAFAIVTLIAGIVFWQARSARRAPAGSALERKNRAILKIPIIVMWLLAVTLSLAALTPLILVNGQFPVPLVVMVSIPIAVVIVSLVLVARASAEPDDTPADHTPDECWKWGQFYYNPDDPLLLVERRFGIGYTLNFARWQSWVILGGILALVVGSLVIAKH
jgi:uncharacterized membrane protein